jgi:hypothetical protein
VYYKYKIDASDAKKDQTIVGQQIAVVTLRFRNFFKSCALPADE